MIEWTHRDEVALQKEITEIVANVSKNAFQSMGLAWLDTLNSEEDEDEQEEQLEGDAIGFPRGFRVQRSSLEGCGDRCLPGWRLALALV